MSDRDDITLILRYCDGELPPAETAELERRLAEDGALRDRVALERALRERVATALTAGTPSAPSELRDRVMVALAEAEPSDAAKPPARPAAPAVTDEPSEERSIPAILRGPRRANLLAVAATLALVATAVLYGIFGPRLDDQAHRTAGQLAEWAQWALEHHDSARSRRGCSLDVSTPEDARQSMTGWLMVDEVPLFDLQPLGYDLVGAGPCQPRGGQGPSCHLVYARLPDVGSPAMVSLFIVPDNGQFSDGAASPETYGTWFPVENGQEGGVRVLHTTDGVLVYLLTCCDPMDLEPVAALMQQVLQGR